MCAECETSERKQNGELTHCSEHAAVFGEKRGKLRHLKGKFTTYIFQTQTNHKYQNVANIVQRSIIADNLFKKEFISYLSKNNGVTLQIDSPHRCQEIWSKWHKHTCDA